MKSAARTLMLVSLVLPTAVAANDAPPRDLQWHGDHWSAWNAPTPPEDARVHVIQAGDTLWDLAGRFYGDPYLWPQLWEQNQYILDAHWIYPGDPLAIGPGALPMGDAQLGDVAAPPLDDPNALDGMATEETTETADTGLEGYGGNYAGGASDGPIPLGYESDLYCSGYIGEDGESFPYRISGTELDFTSPSLDAFREREIIGTYGSVQSEKVGLSVGDIAYIDAGRADGLSAGDLLVAVEPAGLVDHPKTQERVGRFFEYNGRVRILAAQETTSIAEVVLACDMVRVGSGLKRFAPEPVPLRRLTPVRPINYPESAEAVETGASIIYSKDTTISLSSGHLIYIDRGEAHDVAPGDVFTVYRRTKAGLPPIVLGEVAVLSTKQSTSLARILSSRYTVYIGDALLPK